MKKIIAFLLVLVPALGFAYDAVFVDGIYYNLDEKTKQAQVAYNIDEPYSGDIVIPSSIAVGNVMYSVTSIGFGAFDYCSSLTSIEIPSSVTAIGADAFMYCSSLTSIVIPSSITRIEDRAFSCCYSLASIEIPSSVTYIGYGAFAFSKNLTSIYVGSTPPVLNSNITFDKEVTSACILYVPFGCAEAYRNAPYWSEFKNIQEIVTNPMKYEDMLFIGNQQAFVGKDAVLSLQLKNAKDFTGFQAKVYLPEGVSFVNDEMGFVDAYLSETRARGINLDAQEQADGSLLLLAYSSRNIKFVGNEGEVAIITIHLDAEMAEGEYPILLKDIVLTNADGQTYEIECVKSKLAVESCTLGDANGDSKVNVGDISATASYILGNIPPNFVSKAADANGDNKINVGDLSKIASIILGNDQLKALQREAEAVSTSFNMNMRLEPTDDGNYLLHIGVDNIATLFSGFQFDLCLPEGLMVKVDADGFAQARLSPDRTNARQTDLFDCSVIGDGQTRVLCASTRNSMFIGQSGEVVAIMLEAGANFEEKGVIALRHITYTSTGEGRESADVVMKVSNVISSIEKIGDATVVSICDMQGRVAKRGFQSIDSLPQGMYIINGKKVIL